MAMQAEELLVKVTALLMEHQSQVTAQLTQTMEALTGEIATVKATLSSGIDVTALAEAVDIVALARHPVGLCTEDECEVCPEQRNLIAVQVLNRVEEQIPGTRSAMARWHLMNEEVEIEA